jgi:hypothetical protein
MQLDSNVQCTAVCVDFCGMCSSIIAFLLTMKLQSVLSSCTRLVYTVEVGSLGLRCYLRNVSTVADYKVLGSFEDVVRPPVKLIRVSCANSLRMRSVVHRHTYSS